VTDDHILLSAIRDSPNLEDQGPVFIYPTHRVAQLCPSALVSLFHRRLRLAVQRWKYSTPSPLGDLETVKVKVMLRPTVSRPVCLGVWSLRPDLYYCRTAAGFLMWGALSDESTGLPFTIVTGPRQRTHSRVRFHWNSPPYFTVSDSRLPFLSPPTTRRATMDVFDHASTHIEEIQFLETVFLLYNI
jgi:hypothetical protein